MSTASHDDLNRMSDHDLLVVTAERLQSLKDQMETRLSETAKAIVLARDVYPTQKDVAKSLEDAKLDAREQARREATIMFEKTTAQFEGFSGEMRRQISEMREQLNKIAGSDIGVGKMVGSIAAFVGIVLAIIALILTTIWH